MSFVLNGMYPTHPIWFAWSLVAIFECLVVLLEVVITDVFMRDRVKSQIDRYYLALLIIIGNLVTFAVGWGLQLLIVSWATW